LLEEDVNVSPSAIVVILQPDQPVVQDYRVDKTASYKEEERHPGNDVAVHPPPSQRPAETTDQQEHSRTLEPGQRLQVRQMLLEEMVGRKPEEIGKP